MGENDFFNEIEIGLQYKQKFILLEELVKKSDAEGVAKFGEDMVNHIPMVDQFLRERIVGMVYYYYAKSAVKQENYNQAWPYIIKALSSLQEFGDTLMLAKIYLSLGEIVLELDDQASAIESYLSVIDIGEKKNYQIEVAKAYCYYGEILVQVCHYTQAKEMFLSSIEICVENLTQTTVLAEIYGRALTGAIFCLWWEKEKEKAKAYYEILIRFSKSEEGKNLSCIETRFFAVIYESCYGQQEESDKAIQEFCKFSNPWEPTKATKVAMGLAMKYLISSGKMIIAKKILLWMDNHCVNEKKEILNHWLAEIRIAVLVEEDDCAALYQAGETLVKLEMQEKKNKSNSFHKLTMMRSEMHHIEQREFEIKLINDNLLLETIHDAMTKLPNRRFFSEHAHELLHAIIDKGELCVLGIMDIDCFKLVNDTYGHVVGDESIILIADTIKEWCGSDLFCARYGGDEFVVVGTGITKEMMEERAEKLKRRIQLLDIKNSLSPVEPYITISQGYFISPMSAHMNLWKYLTQADNQMYKIKRTTKNGYLVSNQMDVLQGDQNDIITGEIVC